jgi:hypothetical protein
MYVSCRFHFSFHIRHYVYHDHKINYVIRMHFKVITILDEALGSNGIFPLSLGVSCVKETSLFLS